MLQGVRLALILYCMHSNATNKTGREVYIGNLGVDIESISGDFTDMFSPFGSIEDTTLMRNWDAELDVVTEKFGLVTYQSRQPAEAAVSNLDQYEFDGRLLAVSLTTEICLRLSSATSNEALWPVSVIYSMIRPRHVLFLFASFPI